ncbi:MAG TPA: hypothetical protein VGQ30_14845, partial [Gemmatimonadaceae bacterium]|nr:hypothetical protein [Gemmatimonadaceae bacterium]
MVYERRFFGVGAWCHHTRIAKHLRPFTIAVCLASSAHAQRATLTGQARQFIAIDTTIVALTHARIIDGTGAPPRDNQTLIIRDGAIAALGDDGKITIPPGALVVDETGKSVIPGMVQVHEHLFYPTGPGIYGNLAESFS